MLTLSLFGAWGLARIAHVGLPPGTTFTTETKSVSQSIPQVPRIECAFIS